MFLLIGIVLSLLTGSLNFPKPKQSAMLNRSRNKNYIELEGSTHLLMVMSEALNGELLTFYIKMFLKRVSGLQVKASVIKH